MSDLLLPSGSSYEKKKWYRGFRGGASIASIVWFLGPVFDVPLFPIL